MPIPARCSECGARSLYADRYAGETVACKACGADVDVPRNRGGSSGKSGKKSSKQSSSPVIPIIIGLVIAGGIAVAAVVVIALAMVGVPSVPAGAPPAPLPVANNVPVANPQTTVPGASPAVSPAPQFPNTTAANTPTGVAASARPATPPGPTPSGFQTGSSQPPVSSRLSFQKSADWSIEANPPAAADVLTSEKPLKIKLDPDNLREKDVVYPLTNSNYVAVKSGKGSREGFDVYRLSTGAKSGNVPNVGYSSAMALSPDGQYFANTQGGGDKISVYDIQAKKSLGDLATGDGQNRFRVAVLAFPRPDRLVAISQLERGVKVWDLPGGTFVSHITGTDKFSGHTAYACSPGGKYLAVQADYLKHSIEIYNLDDGKLAGAIEIEGQTGSIEIGAIGFSADGTQLAVLYDVQSRGDRRDFSQFVVWDVAAGKTVADFDLTPQLKDQLDPAYQLGRLQPFPTNGRWMVHGRGILDTTQQQLIYSYPKLDRVELAYTRRVMGDNWLVGVVADKADARLEVLTLDEQVLAAAAKTAAAGGLAMDADLPALTPSDYSQVTDAVASSSWSAKPDPAVAAGLPKEMFPVEAGTGAVRDLTISKGAEPRVAVRVAYQEDLDDTKVVVARDLNSGRLGNYRVKVVHPVAKRTVIDLYQASTGERLGRQELPFSGSLLSLSPNGEWGLVEHHRGEGRLDLFHLSGAGSHKLAWRPYRSAEDEGKREVAFAAFVDDQHVGTVNSEGDLVLWNVSDAQPVYRFPGARIFAVSPGGQQLAAVRGNILGDKDIALLDARTGEGLGVIPLEGRTESLAFHPNGQWLAVSHGTEANKMVTIFDMSTGEVAERYPLPDVAPLLQWIGDDYLLLGGQQLVSRKVQAVVWQYTAPEAVFPAQTTSLRCTFAGLSGKTWQVRSVNLPHAELMGQLDGAKLAEKALVKPGDAVSLAVTVSGEPELGALKTTAETQVRERLQKSQLTVGEGNQKTQVVVDVRYKAGETRQLSKMGERTVQEAVVLKTIQFQIKFMAGNKVLWQSERNVGNLDGVLFRLMPNETAQAAVDRGMRERAERTLTGIEFPSYIFGDQAKLGLGSSALAAVK